MTFFEQVLTDAIAMPLTLTAEVMTSMMKMAEETLLATKLAFGYSGDALKKIENQ